MDALLAAAEEVARKDVQAPVRTWDDVARETAAVYARALREA
jgi:hypothetical protein